MLLLMSLALRRALLRAPQLGSNGWLRFEQPIAQIRADRLCDVHSALARIEAAARDGQWAVGYISYDAAPAFDRALSANRDESVPLVAFAVFPAPETSDGPKGTGDYTVGPRTRSSTERDYADALNAIRQHIAAGDVYQVNYTLRLSAAFDGDPETFFAALCRAQPADHLAYLDFGTAVVCSASPELFLRRRGDRVVSKPMKGTRPRGHDPMQDRVQAQGLHASTKERAENTMIVDMVRNDLGRVARVGTVTPTALLTVESYPTVHQLTSTIEARTDASFADLLDATFPPASITGAPKVRATQIIQRLEREPRGVYTGAVGSISPGGNIDLNVAIRTAWIDRKNRRLVYGVGGGIVWDSQPSAEWQETHDKARILRRASHPFQLLETLLWTPADGPNRMERHLERLASSARYFGFDLKLEDIRQALRSIRAPEPHRVRLLVDPDGRFTLQRLPLPAPPTEHPVTLPLDTVPIDPDDEFLRHKTTRRTQYEQARERFPDAFDVILWNPQREVTESTIANVIVELDGERWTPPIDAGLLPGTYRAHLLEAGLVKERAVTIDCLLRSERSWLVNAVRGWIPFQIASR